jgi:phosphoribosylaminoimidazole-succinocarboxamide synthase
VSASPFVRSGKVRDLYAIGADRVLLVASDRISAFDVVLPTLIPDKGRVLTGLSRFWFAETAGIVTNHLLSTDLDDVDPADLPATFRRSAAGPDDGAVRVMELAGDQEDLRGRIMVCRRVDMLPVEVIVRGFLSGTAWRDYRATGTVSGIRLPDGLRESERLPEPIFTPSTKAAVGDHDENISFDEAIRLVGAEQAEAARAISLACYERAATRAAERGIIVADTKFELGLVDGQLVVADEVLTPDSSRFWPADQWQPGTTPPSFDKQPLRDWLETLDWDKTPPPPALPGDVVTATRTRYIEAYERITGLSFADWPGGGEAG